MKMYLRYLSLHIRRPVILFNGSQQSGHVGAVGPTGTVTTFVIQVAYPVNANRDVQISILILGP